jgi:hypothetical protein
MDETLTSENANYSPLPVITICLITCGSKLGFPRPGVARR